MESARSMPCLLALLIGACGEQDRAASGFEFADSAGVTIVSHFGVERRPLDLGAEPLFVLGAGSVEEDQLFNVVGGLFLPDGGIVLADDGFSELRYYSREGVLVRRSGGEGEGPGEFSTIFWIQGLASGEIAAYDPQLDRLTFFDAAGAVRDERQVRFPGDPPAAVDALVGPGFAIGLASRASIVAVPWGRMRMDGVDGPTPMQGVVHVYAPGATASVAIDSVRLRTYYEAPQPQGPPLDALLEAPRFVFGAYGGRIAYSEAMSYRIHVLDDGAPSTIIVEDLARLPFRPDSLPTGFTHAADSLPAYRDLVVDSERRIWVKAGAPPDWPTATWRVFGEDGVRLGRIELPMSAEVLDAAASRILILKRDVLDVEMVEVRRIAWQAVGPGGP